MRPGWRRVAKRGDNRAFAPEEVCDALIPALEEDCRADLSPAFLAIAGALHLDHLAALRSSPANAQTLALTAFKLSRALGLSETETRARLDRVLIQHEREWKSFVKSLGPSSFVANWATHAA